MIFEILMSFLLFLFVTIISMYVINNLRYIRLKIKKYLINLKITHVIDSKLIKLRKYTNTNRIIDAIIILIISLVLSIIVFFISIFFIKIPSTAVILSLITLTIPYIIIDLFLNVYMQRIRTSLPSYIVNLKSNIDISNDIIKAIRITRVEAPLSYSIDNFNEKVKRGINVVKCFDELKEDINIEMFSSLIDALKICYTNGGEYNSILDKYIDISSKQNTEKAKVSEESSTIIITLIVMVIINIFLFIAVVLGNNEYREIILGTIPGHIIINFGIISYIVILYFVYKIYKMEG